MTKASRDTVDLAAFFRDALDDGARTAKPRGRPTSQVDPCHHLRDREDEGQSEPGFFLAKRDRLPAKATLHPRMMV
jgi:hypothetical protein